MSPDFYDNWDDEDDADDLFGSGSGKPKLNQKAKQGELVGEDGIDEEDRRFFEELSKGFSQREGQQQNAEINPQDQQLERNELMDDTRATRQMILAAAAGNDDGVDLEEREQHDDDL